MGQNLNCFDFFSSKVHIA